jgi:hypothetical protein
MTLNPRTWFRPDPPATPLPDLIRVASVGYQREANQQQAIQALSGELEALRALEALRLRNQAEDDGELREALAMAGPAWQLPKVESGAGGKVLREADAQGSYMDLELALQNVEWRREVSGSWMEFSRWGIQQIILISRLYWLKNPMIQRGINVSAQYVFGRGVEISSSDEATNEAIKQLVEDNKAVFGQVALTDQDRRKYYDGNLFWACQTDAKNTGRVKYRTIDPMEIQEIVCDPDDTDIPQLYRRQWIQKFFNYAIGSTDQKSMIAWYPALNYEPADQPKSIGGYEVRWDIPVYHRKSGAPAKWQFGVPLVYAALDWAKAQRRMLEAFATIRMSLAQISMTLTTKGGQQALAGVKDQLSTTSGPNSSWLDRNPTAVDGSIFASGPGTKLEAFNTQGAGGDPSQVREFKLMVAMVFGVPESFFSDMNTSNLATATSLDRPTELGFMAKQEEWREDLALLITYGLKAGIKAPSGKLREALADRTDVVIREARRVRNSKGDMVYEAADPMSSDITVQVNFPTIIESDVPAQVSAIVSAYMGGQGIDQKEAIRLLGRQVDIDNNEDVLEAQYPSEGPDAYNPLRTGEEMDTEDEIDPAVQTEEARAAVTRLSRALKLFREAIR